MTEFNIKKIINDFKNFDSAFIDASSIIYLNKINLLNRLSKTLKLYTLDKIITEIGIIGLNLIICKSKKTISISNDDLLLKYAIEKKIPVISDDKKILIKAGKNNLDYYNSIMMILFLFYKNVINNDNYTLYICELKKIARYSDDIFLKADRFFKELSKIR